MTILDIIRARRDEVATAVKGAHARIAALEFELTELGRAARVLARLSTIPRCPSCASLENYTYKSRAIFKCRDCGKQFSATSGTHLRHHKMPVELYAKAEAMLREGATATEITQTLGIGYKTALGMKRRMTSGASRKASIPVQEVRR